MRPAPYCDKCPDLCRKVQTVCVEGRSNLGYGIAPGQAEVAFVGESPGPTEDKVGTCFTGKAGKLMDEFLSRYLPDRTWTLSNAIRCFPGYKPNGVMAKPTRANLDACFPYLDAEIQMLNPKLIVAMSPHAVSQTILRDDGTPCPMSSKIGDLVGRLHTSRWGTPALVIYHPAYVTRDEVGRRGVWHSQWKHLVDTLNGVQAAKVGEEHYLTDLTEIRDFYQQLMQLSEPVAYDLETTGLDPIGSAYRQAGYSWDGDHGWVVSLESLEAKALHRDWLRRQSPKIVHHSPFDYTFDYAQTGVMPAGVLFDTKALAFLHNERLEMDLERLAGTFIPEFGLVKPPGKPHELPDDTLAYRCARDALATYRIWKHLWFNVLNPELQAHYQRVVFPFLKTVAAMRVRGWKVDGAALANVIAKEGLQQLQIKEKVADLPEVQEWLLKYEEELKLDSPHQKAKILMSVGIEDRRHMPGSPDLIQTGRKILEDHKGEHPLVDTLIKWSTTGDNLKHFYKPILKHSKQDGFLHPGYNHSGKVQKTGAKSTAVDRLSCADPNLMNFPASTRHVIVSRFEDGLIVQGDWSQFHLRILASLANEPLWIEEYNKGEEADLHAATALLLGVDRSVGKTKNFESVYSASADMLEKLTGIRKWIQKMRVEALGTMMVVNPAFPFRTFSIPDAIEDKSRHALNKASNYPIINTEAIAAMFATHRIDRRLQEEGITPRELKPLLPFGGSNVTISYRECEGVMGQNHDSIVCDVRRRNLARTLQVMRSVMIDEVSDLCKDWLKVPLKVDFKIGRSMAGSVLEGV